MFGFFFVCIRLSVTPHVSSPILRQSGLVPSLMTASSKSPACVTNLTKVEHFKPSHLTFLFVDALCDLTTVCPPIGQHDGILIGDMGYTCRPFFMTPYSNPSPGPQARFNAALAQTRSKIETTIGQLRGRFQCLNGLRVVPDRACDITAACAVLHNIATIRKESTLPLCLQAIDDIEPLYLDEPEGLAVRDKIAAQYFS